MKDPNAAVDFTLQGKDKELSIDLFWLRSVLNYDKNTGVFTWSKKININIIIGSIAGCENKRGYLQIGLLGKLFQQHRLAWFYVYGYWPYPEIDHINRIKTDNRIENLRIADRSINSRNRGITKLSVSGERFIYYDKNRKKWRVDFGYGESKKFIGNFKNIEDAKKALQGLEND